MNTIKNESKSKCLKKITVRDLLNEIEICNEYTETAFIGRIYGEEPELYLIVFDKIALAKRPKSTWSGGTTIVIDRFVDLKIKIKEK